MRKKSVDYKSGDSGGWKSVADDLFLAQFRGRPCEICGATHGFYGGRNTRSMGHHLLSKELHRAHRYNLKNIVILCPTHHLGAQMSPHSHDGVAQKAFYEWLAKERPEKSRFMDEHRFDKFNKEWFYRQIYEELGGEVVTSTGKIKDMRPHNHALRIRVAEDVHG